MTEEMQTQINCIIGKNYPEPLVDEKEARQEGVSRSYKARGNPDVRRTSRKINKKHGSRKKTQTRKKSNKGIQTKLTRVQ